MGMIIRTTLYPLRLKFNEKKNFELELEVENEDDKAKMVSVSIVLPDAVTFSTVSHTTEWSKNFQNFKRLGKVGMKIPIYMARRAEPGNFSGKIIVQEHFNEFGVVEREFRKEVPFRLYE